MDKNILIFCLLYGALVNANFDQVDNNFTTTTLQEYGYLQGNNFDDNNNSSLYNSSLEASVNITSNETAFELIATANRIVDKSNKTPDFPEDFTLSFSNLSSHECLKLHEPEDILWHSVYLCVKKEKRKVNIRWSYSGPISNMVCTKITAKHEDPNIGWSDNYICVPQGSPYKFLWSERGKVSGYNCMEWQHLRDGEWGSGKYLCAEKFSRNNHTLFNNLSTSAHGNITSNKTGNVHFEKVDYNFTTTTLQEYGYLQGNNFDNNNSSLNNSSLEASVNITSNETAFELIATANRIVGEKLHAHEFDLRYPPARTDASEEQKDAPIRDRSALWPRGIVPYVLGNSIRNRRWFTNIVKGAMDEWEEKTCVKFRPKTIYDTNYVYIFVGDGCNSDVGMVGGRQTVSLGVGCEHHSVVLHELGHVLGFWHEQNRPDRDKYVKIIKKNIKKNLYFAFRKYSTYKINSLGIPYDYKSIMHYAHNAFGKGRKTTIVALDGKTRRFGNTHLSALDIEQTKRLYKCPDKSNKNPDFPEDFTFTFSKRPSHKCYRLYEPYDISWRRVYLCVKKGKRKVNIRWSYSGPISNMVCTKITAKHKRPYTGWSDNYICVPRGSPYKFLWSERGKISGYNCMKWQHLRDREWGSGKYLCAKSDDKPVNGKWSPWSIWGQCTKKCGIGGYQIRRRECNNPPPKNGGRTCLGQAYQSRYCNTHKCNELPRWPQDFTYRYHNYSPSSTTCIRTYERAQYFQWTSYYFCSRYGRRDINMKWSDNGPIRYMKCVKIDEPQEARRNGWDNNYLCVPKNSPYNFVWSNKGPISSLACIQWYAKGGKDGWNNNYLCAQKFNGRPDLTTNPPAINGQWSSWGRWTTCSRSCGVGFMTRYRTCSNPYPKNGGKSCIGGREMKQKCNTQECPSVCFNKYSGNSGVFQSTSSRRGQCTWIIQVPSGYRVRLRFTYFSVGVNRYACSRNSDHVTIRDGQHTTARLLKTLCGSSLPPLVYGSGNSIRITLNSFNNINSGFRARWVAVRTNQFSTTPTPKPTTTKDVECGGVINTNKGNISSPNYPEKYPRNIKCTWIIKVPVHKLLKLRFLSFNLESHSSCEYDYVKIRDGASLKSKLLGSFCGSTLPAPVTAFANSLYIEFKSDLTNEMKGFKAEFYTKRRKFACGGKRWKVYTTENGTRYCYLIKKKKTTWRQARNDCKRKKSDLLSIADSEENWFVRNELMAEVKYYQLWMGFNDLIREGNWAWSDKSQVNFEDWDGGDPNNGGRRRNEDCGVLKPDGKWNDYPCNYRFKYICKKKLIKDTV